MIKTNLELKAQANNYPSLKLSDRHLCDLELIMNGGFSPLDGFMSQNDYDAVVSDMRLSDGSLWPIPITLDINDKFVSVTQKVKISSSQRLSYPML